MEIESISNKKLEIESQVKENSEKLSELQREEDKIHEQREQLRKKTTQLQDSIMKFSKLASKSNLNLKGTEYLRKEETYNELLSDYNSLVNKKY